MQYLFIALGACIVGATSGLGGGVIIKPLLDMVSGYGAETINALSTITVLAMSITALVKSIHAKVEINLKLGALLSLGAFIGGYAGNRIFKLLLTQFSNKNILVVIQNAMLAVILLGVLFYMNKLRDQKTYKIKNTFLILLTGLLLGTISSFLGIGGGPINMLILVLFFSMDTKSATINSILLISFSQISKLLTISLTSGFVGLDLSALWLMIPAGVVGGLIGSRLNRSFSAKKIMIMFNVALLFVIAVAVLNFITAAVS